MGHLRAPAGLQDMEVRAELGQELHSVETDVPSTCVSWKGGRAGDRKVGEKGAQRWGWGGAGRVSRKCCSAPLTLRWFLETLTTRTYREQCWSRYGRALPPVHFRSGLVLLTPIANSKVAVTPPVAVRGSGNKAELGPS